MDYFVMLAEELRGERFNKAEHNRAMLQRLNDRTRASIERKHQNISAILYRVLLPIHRRLQTTRELPRAAGCSAGEARLSRAIRLNETVNAIVEEPIDALPKIDDLLSIQVALPVRGDRATHVYEEPVARIQPLRRNYLEIEARNQSHFRAGEDFVLRFEHERLTRIGEREQPVRFSMFLARSATT